jgi:hypothetical protein
MFVARPRKARVIAVAVAVFFLVAFAVVAVLLRSDTTGVNFYVSDQVAMAGVGVVLACGALWFGRPRVRADRDGVEVRNMLGTRRFAWSAWSCPATSTCPSSRCRPSTASTRSPRCASCAASAVRRPRPFSRRE